MTWHVVATVARNDVAEAIIVAVVGEIDVAAAGVVIVAVDMVGVVGAVVDVVDHQCQVCEGLVLPLLHVRLQRIRL